MERLRLRMDPRPWVILAVTLFGCLLVALAPERREDEVRSMETRLHVALPDISFARSTGLIRGEEIYVSTPYPDGPDAVRRIARIRPMTGDRLRLAMYDEKRGAYGPERTLDLKTTISRIGLEALRQ